MKDWAYGGGGVVVVLPACVACTVTVPMPVSVRLVPERVAGPDKMVKLTGRPELAVASKGKVGSPKARLGSEPKVMV